MVVKEKRAVDFAYVNYFETPSALRAAKNKTLFLNAIALEIKLSRPKFSKKMLMNVPTKLKSYIKQVQKGLIEYCPFEFAKIEDEMVAD